MHCRHPEERALRARLEGWPHAFRHPSRLAEDGSHLRITAPGPESINFLFSEFQGTCGKRRHLKNAFQQPGPLIYGSLSSERRRLRRGTEMTDSIERAIDPAPVH